MLAYIKDKAVQFLIIAFILIPFVVFAYGVFSYPLQLLMVVVASVTALFTYIGVCIGSKLVSAFCVIAAAIEYIGVIYFIQPRGIEVFGFLILFLFIGMNIYLAYYENPKNQT